MTQQAKLTESLNALLEVPVSDGPISFDTGLSEGNVLKEVGPALIALGMHYEAEEDIPNARRAYERAELVVNRWQLLDDKGIVGLVDSMSRWPNEDALTGQMVYLIARFLVSNIPESGRRALALSSTTPIQLMSSRAPFNGVPCTAHSKFGAISPWDQAEAINLLCQTWRRNPKDTDLLDLFEVYDAEINAHLKTIDDSVVVENALREAQVGKRVRDYILGTKPSWPADAVNEGEVYAVLVDAGIPNDHVYMIHLLRAVAKNTSIQSLYRAFMTRVSDVPEAYLNAFRFLELTGLSPTTIVGEIGKDFEGTEAEGIKRYLGLASK